MLILETVIITIYDFINRFIISYIYSIFFFKRIFLRLKGRVENNLLNPHLFLAISFLFFVPTCIIVDFNAGNSASILKSFKTFYGDYSLLLELVIVSPLIITSEGLLYLLKKVKLFSDGKERDFFGNTCRYILGGLFLTCYVVRFFNNSIETVFNITFLSYEFQKYILIFVPLVPTLFLIYSVYKYRFCLFKRKWMKISLLFPLLMFYALPICFKHGLRIYYMKLNSNKVHIITGEEYNVLHFKLLIDTSTQRINIFYPNTHQSRSNSTKDSVELVTRLFLMNNVTGNACVLNLRDFVLLVKCPPQIGRRDTLNFFLHILPSKFTRSNDILEIKLNELKMIELMTKLSNAQLKYFLMYQSSINSMGKFTIQGDLYPEYSDKSNYLYEKMNIKFDVSSLP